MNLFLEQKKAVEKMGGLVAGALFMEPGTGKTRVALEILKARQAHYDFVVWIAPACLLAEPSYHAEIKQWSGGLTRPVHFFSVEGISASDRKYLQLIDLLDSGRAFGVVDESITIKNTEAGRTKRLLQNYHKFAFRLILNGTPLTRGLMDLYAQIQFISPSILKMTEAQFAAHFLVYKEDGYKPWKRWSKPENEAALVEILRPYIFDSRLDFAQGQTQEDIDCGLCGEEQAAYYGFKCDYLKDKVSVDFLAMANAFQHFYTGCADKYQKLGGLLRRLNGEKVIIYCKFLDEVAELKERLGPSACVYTGAQKDPLEDFRLRKPVLLCTYGVGSMGLNLQYCRNVVYFSQTFDYKDKVQSLHRVKRTGQQCEINIYNFWVGTGLENLIRRSLDKKSNTLANVKKFIEEHGYEKL